MVPRENKNNAHAKAWGGDKQRAPWHFTEWQILMPVAPSFKSQVEAA